MLQYDIAHDIMTDNTIRKIRLKVEQFRNTGGAKAKKAEGLAKAVGRKRHPRGKEPTWVSESLPYRPPLSIPHHGKGTLSPGVRDNIADTLDQDLDELEARVIQQRSEGNGHA